VVGLVPGLSSFDPSGRSQRRRARWLIYVIAASGVVINLVYFAIELPGQSYDSFSINLNAHLTILSLIIIFPLFAILADRMFTGFRTNERSRHLELEVAARTKQLEDLKSFSENIMSSVNDIIFVIGSDGRFQFVSGNSQKILGREPESLLGRQFIDLVAPGGVAAAVNNFERIMWNEEVPSYELEVKDCQGGRKWLEISSTAYLENDEVVAQVGVARDVTARKKLEDNVLERNRELAALNAVAVSVGQSLDLDQVLQAALDQVAGLLSPECVCVHLYDSDTGQLDLRVSKGGDPEILKRNAHLKLGEGIVGIVAEQGEPMVMNTDNDYSNGGSTGINKENGIASVAAVPMKCRDRLIGVMGTTSSEPDHFSPEDIELLRVISSQVAMSVENALLFEDLKEKSMELEGQNEELALATDKISNLITAAERQRSFSVRYENHKLVKCWEVKGCASVDCPSYKSRNLRCWQVAGTHCGGEVQGVFAQKFGKCEKCNVYKMARSDRLTGLGEDFNNMMAILEQKVEEQQQLQEQLVHSTKLAAIGELAANIAHEINNPLTGVLGYAALLLRELDESDPKARNLKVIENETIRARDIVRNLLDFARQDGLKKRKASIKEVMDDTLPLLRKQADLINVEVKTVYEEDVPQVYVDVNQMKQVFINILNNALHAMPDGGILKIAIRAAKPDGKRPWVEVAFTDTGIGIAPMKLGQVFNPFFTSKDVGEGTGLGLSVSQRIIEEHGGSIGVQSAVGVGSTFTVKLPTAVISADFRQVA